MRLAAAGVGMGQVTAVLLTHLHSDHVNDFNDVVTTHWIGSFAPTPLLVVGPPGTQAFVDADAGDARGRRRLAASPTTTT